MPEPPDDTRHTWDTGPGVVPAVTVGVLGERYDDLGVIGTGGGGTVHRVRDRRLDRVLAMKIARWCSAQGGPHLRRFEQEATITARLQHPGIIPIHDYGTLPDGRAWYTMPEVRGRTLEELVHAVHRAISGRSWRRTADGWTFRRLIDVLMSATRTVSYAHSEGVIHRDLKPANILVGAFGEVQIVDWGIAMWLAGGTDAPRRRSIVGTPGFMAPEQAAGDPELQTARTDVYGLGAILYAMLTGAPPYQARGATPWHEILSAPPPPIRAQMGEDHPTIPEELEQICQAAMHREPERRPDAEGLAAELTTWLDGSARYRRAAARIEEVVMLADQARTHRGRAALLRKRSDAILEEIRPYDPVDRKAPAWDLADRAAEAEATAEELEARYVHGLHTALYIAPELPAAHDRLADHFRERLEHAEASGQRAEALRAETFLRAHDHGRHASWLRGDGWLTVLTDPPGATVVAHRIERVRRRLVPDSAISLGETPIVERPLASGSYRLVLSHQGCSSVTYPVEIGRGGHWHGTAPGSWEPQAIWLPPGGRVDGMACHVPAGWFQSGGDPEAVDGLSGRRLWVDGFFVQRFPVSNRDYIAFLDALAASGEEAEVDRCVPAHHDEVSVAPVPVFRRDPEGRFAVGTGVDGIPLHPDEPVMLVDRYGARAYARWLSERCGVHWRLPHDQEWEKAARGVDGRAFPWGAYLDPTWCCMQQSHSSAPRRRAVDAYPIDESPYGVRGLGGNIRDWCHNAYDRAGPADGSRVDPFADPPEDAEFFMVRGGSWASGEAMCRAASRLVARANTRATVYGIRLVASVADLRAGTSGPRG